ncbi:hypothetical protein CfE428DRAFT_1014 [Chthoniobacter flavus Ellin428]|uniref:Uncharacterized protein n=1 Tax=Chthoniobacter flavus Ellin428 TaxID=497964 RepID=B4CWH7_9BACT|nr:hypothetical protein [Chthoniobacter flavus]EDY21769.1 hypothetical protein CfE428DRAFT_1014 [Chthoniobacter flavus Ellin428]TCO95701.1 hypothetical protein EV701_101391 [Chthoniobacter flavus]
MHLHLLHHLHHLHLFRLLVVGLVFGVLLVAVIFRVIAGKRP